MSADIGGLLRGERRNAALSWALVGLVGVAAAIGFVRGDALWTGFAVVVAALVLLPPVTLGDARAMLPWEVTLLAALPVLGRSFATVPVTGNLATYLSVAAIALIVTVELHLFTPVRMTTGFAMGFVVVTTLATAGLWAVVRWVTDRLVGTTFLLDPTVSEDVVEHALMVEFTASTAAGVLAALVFGAYVHLRVPDVPGPEEVGE